HIAVRQLVPCLGKRFGELARVLVKALGNRRVDRVQAQCQVRREHHRRVLFLRIVSIRYGGLCRRILGTPLAGPARPLPELPLVAEEVLEVAVVPFHWVPGPGALEPASDRVRTFARPKSVLPAETLLLKAASLGFGTAIFGRGRGAVGF